MGQAWDGGLSDGVFWWILGAQILMPVLLGMPPFASVMMPPMRMVAMGSLVGHLIFGLILGAGFVRISKPTEIKVARPA
ncbi:MAG TPA: hypothetical protein VGJ48_03785 [Pyrinomonadaceae bacterium]